MNIRYEVILPVEFDPRFWVECKSCTFDEDENLECKDGYVAYSTVFYAAHHEDFILSREEILEAFPECVEFTVECVWEMGDFEGHRKLPYDMGETFFAYRIWSTLAPPIMGQHVFLQERSNEWTSPFIRRARLFWDDLKNACPSLLGAEESIRWHFKVKG